MQPPNPKPPSLPSATADCITEFRSAVEGANLTRTASRWTRSLDGKLRFDSGYTSVITDPASGKTLVLDHLKREARIFEQNPPAMPGMPQAPDWRSMMPQQPQRPDMQIQDLGKRVIDGVMAEGKRYLLQPPAAPQIPPLPNAPQPNLNMLEVWMNPETQFPVLTRTVGQFGEEIRRCKVAPLANPSPADFQIPAGYKQINPYQPPPMPSLPGAASPISTPQAAPTTPQPLAAPSLPQAPPMPAAPVIPSAPRVPQPPGQPKPPGLPKL